MRKGGINVKRYEVRKIGFNWFGIYDLVRREFVIETTGVGIEVYREMFEC